MKKNMASKHWMVIFTKSNCEKKLYKLFEQAGLTACLPLYDVVRQWSDRKKKVTIPLIPGVVFLKTTMRNSHMIYRYPYVNGILKESGKPGVVKEEEIHNLNIIAREWNGKHVESQPAGKFRAGDSIQISRGTFAGLSGTLIRLNGKHRLVVQISALNLEYLVNVPMSQVKRTAPA
jgi:transcription antitermination factor NusG